MHENWNAKNVFVRKIKKEKNWLDGANSYWGIKTVKNKIWLINWHEKNGNI